MPKPLVAHGRPVSACERCRAGKTGCDRVRPSCSRCTRAGTLCEYKVPSKRTARHLVCERQTEQRCDKATSSRGAESSPPGSHNIVSRTTPTDELNGMSAAEDVHHCSVSNDHPSRENSPQVCPIKLKRDRAILSCVRCRKHKVRCDRKVPCGRCIKARREAQCVYTEPVHTAPRPVVWDGDAALNTIAVECRAAAGAAIRSRAPGLPDHAYENDGQLTKRETRATLTSLRGAHGYARQLCRTGHSQEHGKDCRDLPRHSSKRCPDRAKQPGLKLRA